MKPAARVISLFLMLGGLLGFFGTYFLVVHAIRQHQGIRVISTVVSAVLFAACILSGVELWSGKPRGFKFAKILLGLQIPVFALARFTYEFSTFFSLRVMIGNTNRTIGANIGSSGNIYLLPQSPGFMAGINLVAVAALCCLYVISRPSENQSALDAAGLRREAKRPVNHYCRDEVY
jgi:hypothetical protein